MRPDPRFRIAATAAAAIGAVALTAAFAMRDDRGGAIAVAPASAAAAIDRVEVVHPADPAAIDYYALSEEVILTGAVEDVFTREALARRLQSETTAHLLHIAYEKRYALWVRNEALNNLFCSSYKRSLAGDVESMLGDPAESSPMQAYLMQFAYNLAIDGAMDTSRAIALLVPRLESGSSEVVSRAVTYLADLRWDGMRACIDRLLREPSAVEADALRAIPALGRVADEYHPIIVDRLARANGSVLIAAIVVAGELRLHGSVARLRELAGSSELDVVDAARHALERISAADAG